MVRVGLEQVTFIYTSTSILSIPVGLLKALHCIRVSNPTLMSRTPVTPSIPSFSPSSYKRRSLQSPFLTESADTDSDGQLSENNKKSNNNNNNGDTYEDNLEGELRNDVDSNFKMPLGPSLHVNKRQHKRNTSTASMNYTPQVIDKPPTPGNGPFNFSPMMLNNNSNEALSVPTDRKTSYRRGHRYKHSSVSMNMFQDPQRIASMQKPHNLPKTYTVPAFQEVKGTITRQQKVKLVVCIFQSCVVMCAYIGGMQYGNGLDTLAHILFYDVISNFSEVAIKIMSNFEVWRVSSLRYPFGLARIEVLFDFALAVSLLFVGLDLFSHVVEEMLIDLVGTNGEAHPHSHGVTKENPHSHPEGMNGWLYVGILGLAIITTILTSYVVHGDKSTSKRPNNEVETEDNAVPAVKRISSITLKEPIRVSTFKRVTLYLKKHGYMLTGVHLKTTSILSLGYALLVIITSGISSTFVIIATAIVVTVVAWRQLSKKGKVLLLGGVDIAKVVDAIEGMECFKSGYRVSDVKIARVHGECDVCLLRVEMKGASSDDEAKLRFYAARTIKESMGDVEVTVDITRL